MGLASIGRESPWIFFAVPFFPSLSHPLLTSETIDPLNEIQAPLEQAVLHELVSLVRAATFSWLDGQLTKYTQVIGVGHSFGSVLTCGVADLWPADFDAVVLTGFTLVDAFFGVVSAFLFLSSILCYVILGFCPA